uniref:Uncharacterized protein n=1 Tax=viral metagenome TaxID=1070528 RepID=A0A6C0K4K1_9ZZZZ
MLSLTNATPLQIGIGVAVIILVGYCIYVLIKRSIDGFGNYTGINKRVDYPTTHNNTEAKGSQQNSPGLNATGMAESADNPLRDAAPVTMATPYTTQPPSR